jgi:hypothetical protein
MKADLARKFRAPLVLFLLLGSLATNYVMYRSSKNVHINGGNDANFSVYGDDVIFTVDGCLVWQDEKNRSDQLYQYWKIRALRRKRSTSCTLVEATQLRGSVIVSNPEECTLTSIDPEAKTATVSYKDAVITVNRDRAIWTTSNPDEKGGGELVPCWDSKLNWYLL